MCAPSFFCFFFFIQIKKKMASKRSNIMLPSNELYLWHHKNLKKEFKGKWFLCHIYQCYLIFNLCLIIITSQNTKRAVQMFIVCKTYRPIIRLFTDKVWWVKMPSRWLKIKGYISCAQSSRMRISRFRSYSMGCSLTEN